MEVATSPSVAARSAQPVAPAAPAAPAKPATPAAGQATLSPRLATGLVGMLLASLLAIVNEQVTAQSMVDIQGALSIGHDEGTWLTALFEAANVSIMVFAPWFGITFTLKRFTIAAVLATMVLGLLCAVAPNFETLCALRILQGLSGGCLPPMLIIVALRYLPPKVKLYGLAGYALTATFGPALGTPLAALWTEYVSWRAAFWQVLPLGIVSCIATQWGLPQDQAKLERFRSFNWVGLLIGLPAIVMLVIALLQGDRLDWLDSGAIRILVFGGLALLVAFLINEWFHPLPFFKLQLLARRNFLHGLATLAGAVALLVGTASIPGHYLAQVHGYRPLQAAPLSLFLAGPLLVTLPLTASLLNKKWIDYRWVLGTGLVLMVVTCLLGAQIDSDWTRDNFFMLQGLQILAQPMVIMGILMGVTTGLPPTEGPFASAMFNSLKTFSAAATVSLIESMSTDREHFHSTELVDQLGNRPLDTPAVDTPQGLGQLAHGIHEQVLVLTTADLYHVMMCIAIVLLVLVIVLPVRIYPPWMATPHSTR